LQEKVIAGKSQCLQKRLQGKANACKSPYMEKPGDEAPG
jgi:hypothetical protein